MYALKRVTSARLPLTAVILSLLISPVMAQTTPTTVQNNINSVPWTNTSGQVTGPVIQGLLTQLVTLFNGGYLGALATLNTITSAYMSPGAAAGNLGYTPGTFTIINTSQTIAVPGHYLVSTPGLTLTIPNSISAGDIEIKDGTGSSNPNITLAGEFDASGSGLSLTLPNVSLSLTWDSTNTTYRIY